MWCHRSGLVSFFLSVLITAYPFRMLAIIIEIRIRTGKFWGTLSNHVLRLANHETFFVFQAMSCLLIFYSVFVEEDPLTSVCFACSLCSQSYWSHLNHPRGRIGLGDNWMIRRWLDISDVIFKLVMKLWTELVLLSLLHPVIIIWTHR